MTDQRRIEDYGINIGELPKGKLNKITDVKGVMVGHCTIDTDENKTGVKVILPIDKNILKNMLVYGTISEVKIFLSAVQRCRQDILKIYKHITLYIGRDNLVCPHDKIFFMQRRMNN